MGRNITIDCVSYIRPLQALFLHEPNISENISCIIVGPYRLIFLVCIVSYSSSFFFAALWVHLMNQL